MTAVAELCLCNSAQLFPGRTHHTGTFTPRILYQLLANTFSKGAEFFVGFSGLSLSLDSSFRLCQEKSGFVGEIFENRLSFKLLIATLKGSCNAGFMNQDLDQRDGLNFIPLVGIPTYIYAPFCFPPPVPQHPHRVQNYTVLCQTADLFNPFQFLACSWAEKLTETG